MRRHKRLRDGFTERLVPQVWPFTPEMQAPALIRPDYGLVQCFRAGDASDNSCDQPDKYAPSEPCSSPGQAALSGASETSNTPLSGLSTNQADPAGESVNSPYTSPQYCDLWIQAASGGESYLAWEILRLLAACGGGLRVLCTTCTRQGLEVLHKAQQELALASIEITVNFLPLDEPPLMRRAVAQVFGPLPNDFPARPGAGGRTGQPGQPVSAVLSVGAKRKLDNSDTSGNFTRGRVLVLLETEIWPGLLAACAQAGVRVLILNGRMTEGSFKAYRLLAPLLRRHAPQDILATSENDLRRFSLVFDGKCLELENNALDGDLKGDFSRTGQGGQEFAEEERPQASNGLSEPSAQPVRVDAPRTGGREAISTDQPRRGLMRNIKFDRVFLGGEARRPDPARRPASGAAPYPPEREAADCLAEHSGLNQVRPRSDGIDLNRHPIGSASSGNLPENGASFQVPGPILLASTREEEEEQLLAVLAALRVSGPEFPVIVAPRHLHRIAAWEKGLSAIAAGAEGLASFGKRSDHPDAAAALPRRSGEIRLWDAFGEMDLLYSRASAVFVGGSLAPLGGQNFLEPLAAGLEPVIGPSWSNFYWAGNELFDMKLVRMVQNASELAPALLDLARSPRPRREVISRFNAYLTPRRGGTRQAVELILEQIRLGRGLR